MSEIDNHIIINNDVIVLNEQNVSLFNQLSHPIIVSDSNKKIQFCNSAFVKLFGYSTTEVINKLDFDFFVLKYFDYSFYEEGNLHQDENNFSFFATLKTNRLAKIQSFILLSYNLSNNYTLSFLINHSEKIEYLNKIFTKNTQIKQIFDSIPDIIFIFDKNFRVKEINYKEGSYLLKSREELIDKYVDELPLMDSLKERTKNYLSKVFESRMPLNYEYFLGEGADIHYFECRLLPSADQVIAIIRDITENKKKEAEIKEKEIRYRNILENISQSLIEVSSDGTILYKNHKYIEFLLLSSITDRNNLKDIIGEEVFNLLLYNFNNNINRKSVYPFGHHIIEFSISERKKLKNEKSYIFLLNDVSENEINKRALQESKDNYEILVESSPNGIIIRDFECIYYANKKAKEIFNIEDINNLDFSDYFTKADLMTFKGRLSAVKNGIDVSYKEFHMTHPGRKDIIIETKPVYIKYKGKPAFQIVFRDISLQKKLQEERFEKQLMIETNRNLRAEIDNRLIIEDELRNSLDQNTLLLKEIHHRIKNNFQVISSLINFTAKNFSDPLLNKSFIDINSRIKSMAIVHDFFYKSEDFSSVLISEYLYKIHSEFLRESSMNKENDSFEFRSKISEICIGIDDAITIGLIFNELMVLCKYLHDNFTNKYCNFVELKQIDSQRLELCMKLSGDENGKSDILNQFDLRLLEVLISQINGVILKEDGICKLRLKMELTKKV